MSADSNGSNYYLFGGLKNDGITYLSDLYELDIAKNTWTKLKDAPSDGRDQMACTVSGMTLIVWGGTCYAMLQSRPYRS